MVDVFKILGWIEKICSNKVGYKSGLLEVFPTTSAVRTGNCDCPEKPLFLKNGQTNFRCGIEKLMVPISHRGPDPFSKIVFSFRPMFLESR